MNIIDIEDCKVIGVAVIVALVLGTLLIILAAFAGAAWVTFGLARSL